jgi:hypothetical protein
MKRQPTRAVTKIENLIFSENQALSDLELRRVWQQREAVPQGARPLRPAAHQLLERAASGRRTRRSRVQDQIDFLKSNGLAQFAKYYDGTAGAGPAIVDQTPPDAIAQQIWATCEHGDDSNFFGWHRMYL